MEPSNKITLTDAAVEQYYTPPNQMPGGHNPKVHFLSSKEWRAVKEQNKGWQPGTIGIGNSEIYYYRKMTPLGGVIYIPGYFPGSKIELAEITDQIKKIRGNNLVCKLEPTSPLNSQLQGMFETSGWVKARRVQSGHTVILDLTKPIELLEQELKRRARYEVKKAIKNGVTVQNIEPNDSNLEQMYNLLASTAKRKKFSVRQRKYLFDFWRAFRDSGKLKLYFALHDKDILSSAVIIHDPELKYAWYKDGASTTIKSNLLGSRLLLWEIAKDLKNAGYHYFDFGGIPNPENFDNSKMRGIYVFKSAYTHQTSRYVDAYELPLAPKRYKFWPKLELAYLKQAKIRSTLWY